MTVRPRDVQPFASATPSSEPAASASGQVPRVVIVGAGFGGLLEVPGFARCGAQLNYLVDPEEVDFTPLRTWRGAAE